MHEDNSAPGQGGRFIAEFMSHVRSIRQMRTGESPPHVRLDTEGRQQCQAAGPRCRGSQSHGRTCEGAHRAASAQQPLSCLRQGHLCLGPRPQLARRTPPGAARNPSASPAIGESATGPPHSADGCTSGSISVSTEAAVPDSSGQRELAQHLHLAPLLEQGTMKAPGHVDRPLPDAFVDAFVKGCNFPLTVVRWPKIAARGIDHPSSAQNGAAFS